MQLLKRNFRLDQIDEIAHLIIKSLPASGVVTFEGDLGAGKTTLIRTICGLLNVVDTVSSPTFSLMNLYKTSAGSRYTDIIHIDFYRISNEQEAVRAGLEEYLYSGACCLIEWPQQASGIIPADALRVKLSVMGEDERQVEVESA
ncbi:MAG: tRNA (adenosine(37)-N6)-threonylcarbamoyltransferase complex ATPase subunit type 1 TsaE [Chitinophagaceae bacterium]|jgi:tRNA threonylcarbamoyladenosine biosynthesis protein TsaE